MSKPNISINLLRSDLERLEAFTRCGDELAFQQIVKKYHRLVFSAALRRCGQRELAEEAMQNTFAILARKSKQLLKHPTLSGWLHRTAMLEASTLLRSERTRRRKHIELMEHETLHSDPQTLDASFLDEALARLSSRDRDVILMHFYEGMNFDEIGQQLGKSNAACQRRSHRAVQKLSRLLSENRSTAVATAAIALTASTQLANASSLNSTSAISKIAIARSTDITLSTLAINTLNTMNYTKTVTVAAITLALLIPVGLQSKEAARLKREVATISRQISGLGQHRSNKHEPAMPLTAMILPKNSAKGIAKVDADEVEPNPPSPLTVVAQAFGNLKREEIFYQRKYADAVPKPNDPEYAEYVADMDAFMRQLGKDMVAIAAHETDLDLEPASVKAEFFADVLSQAIKLDDATATKARTILSEKFGEHSDLIESSDSRPKDPKLLPEWEEQNELVLGSAWDEIHELLSPEEQKNLEFGFPRRSIVGRSIGIGFPGGKGF